MQKRVLRNDIKISPEAIRDELKRCGVQFIVMLPDSPMGRLWDVLYSDPDLRFVQICREAEGVGISSGIYYGGKDVALVISYKGFYNAIDAVAGVAIKTEVPLLMLISDTGGKQEGGDYTEERYTEGVLRALGIPYYILKSNQDLGKISQAHQEAHSLSRPVALLMHEAV